MCFQMHMFWRRTSRCRRLVMNIRLCCLHLVFWHKEKLTLSPDGLLGKGTW